MPRYPLTSGPEISVNFTTTGNQGSSSVAGRPDGSFVITWTATSATGDDTSGSAVRGQIFHGDSTLYLSEFVVNTVTANDQSQAVVTGFADSTSVVAWYDHSEAAGSFTANIQLQLLNVDGSPIGAQTTLAPFADVRQETPAITALDGGGFAVAYKVTGLSRPDASGSGIEVVVVGPDGTIGDPIAVNTITTGAQTDPTITALAGGGIVVAWQDASDTLPDDSIDAVRAQVFSALGQPINGEILVNSVYLSRQEFPSVTGLADGGFVVTWTDSSQAALDHSSTAIAGQVFNSNGIPVGNEFQVNQISDGGQSDPAVAALPDGRFVVVWQDGSNAAGDTSGTAIRGQVINTDGTYQGDEFVINTHTTGFQIEPAVASLTDGRFVVSWTDLGGTGRDGDGSAVVAQVMDARTEGIRLLGSDLADTYVGSRYHDQIWGLEERDVISGGGRRDRLSGGTQSDTLSGDKGDDQLLGGKGADRLVGGRGQDVLIGGKGADTLVGSGGVDVFAFRSAAEARGDVIFDFRVGVDFINVATFMRGGHFIGLAAFSGHGAEIRYAAHAGTLRGDVDGDGHADWSLTFAQHTHLADTDFVF